MRLMTACAVALVALTPAAFAQTFKSSAGDLKVETVVSGIANPWAPGTTGGYVVATRSFSGMLIDSAVTPGTEIVEESR